MIKTCKIPNYRTWK